MFTHINRIFDNFARRVFNFSKQATNIWLESVENDGVDGRAEMLEDEASYLWVLDRTPQLRLKINSIFQKSEIKSSVPKLKLTVK